MFMYCQSRHGQCDGCPIKELCGDPYGELADLCVRELGVLQDFIDGFVRNVNWYNSAERVQTCRWVGLRGCAFDKCAGYCDECKCVRRNRNGRTGSRRGAT